MNSSQIARLVAPAFGVVALALASSAFAAARPDDRAGIRGVGVASGSASVRPDDRSGFRDIDLQPASPQAVLDALKRSSPNQVGLAWQYLRDTGQLAQSSPQTILDAVKRTSPNQVGLAWQYLRDTRQIATPTTPSTPAGDGSGARGTNPRATVSVRSSTGFDWSDAGSGAAGAVGLMMLLGGAALTQRRSQRRTRMSA